MTPIGGQKARYIGHCDSIEKNTSKNFEANISRNAIRVFQPSRDKNREKLQIFREMVRSRHHCR